jgi:transcriptional regulator with XRE-family HTH domain
MIGNQIRLVRKTSGRSQPEFAEMLGVKAGYISMLERNLKKPSEQLVLNICRTFQVNRRWLEEEKGEMTDKSELPAKGHGLLDEINRRLVSGNVQVSLRSFAMLAGIDSDNFPENRDRFVQFKCDDIDVLVRSLLTICSAGDKSNITAIRSLLRALVSKKGSEEIETETKGRRKKEALSHIRKARAAEIRKDFRLARKEYLEACEALDRINGAGEYSKEVSEAVREYEAFVDRDPIYRHIFHRIVGVLEKHPGMLEKDLFRLLADVSRADFLYVLETTQGKGNIRRYRKGRTYELYKNF